MDKQKKNQRFVHVRCDEEDYAQLGYLARKAGMSRSEFIRQLIYHGKVESHTNYSSEDAQKLLDELCNISNAMGTIAYNARIKLCVDEQDFLQLESCFKNLFEAYGEHIIR